MKLIKFALLSGLILSCTNVFADIKFNVSQNATVVLVDGKKQQLNANPIILPNGEHQIGFRYEKNIKDGDGYFFSSNIILIKFKGENQTISLKLPELRTKYQASVYNKKPTLSLISSGQMVPFKQDLLLKKGFQLSRDLVAEITAYNLTNKPAALKSLVPGQVSNNSVSKKDKFKQNQIEKKFIELYENADNYTKSRIKAYINNK